MSEEKRMLEEEIQKKIQQSAKEQEIPNALLPEKMVARLNAEQPNRKKAQCQKRSWVICRMVEMAAAVALVIAVGRTGSRMLRSGDTIGKEEDVAKETPIGAGAEEAGTDASTGEESKKTDLLAGYHVASGYAEIYELINETTYYELAYEESDGVMNESASPETAEDTAGTAYDKTADSVDFSSTNVQQEGVDESDLVKTDGSYLYRVKENEVEIIDIRNKKLEKIGAIKPELEAADTIVELYVDGDQLFVIVSRMDSELYDTGIGLDSYFWGSRINNRTELLTYDISTPAEPKKTGTFSQDGEYYTSRKAGNFIYLFTRNNLFYADYENAEAAIPRVQGEKVSCEDIYIGSQAYAELIMASVDTANASASVDEKVIIDDYSNIYVGNSAIYLYQSVYENGNDMTQLVKFSYEAGKMEPVGSSLVKGIITDTFAISEQNGYLRVLTSSWNDGERSNQLYVLDEKLKVTGQIKDIAKGESVYAARYIGNVAYFITYRNMDPLFVADLSDPQNPKLLGSVEVTGFSDYLHLYQKELVLGIGYETDEDSNRQGVKLCMFDVSNPLSPKVKATEVMEDADSMTADYDYKSVIVDAKKDLIGFVTASWEEEFCCEYRLFTWNGEQFEEVLKEPLPDEAARAVYVGDVLYLVKKDSIKAFDMLQDFAELGEL